jgi:hypothetical protein
MVERSVRSASEREISHWMGDCAGIAPMTSCVVGEYSNHYANSAVQCQMSKKAKQDCVYA